MSNSIVKLSVLLSANASQATGTLRQFAIDAQSSSMKAKQAFNGQSMRVDVSDGWKQSLVSGSSLTGMMKNVATGFTLATVAAVGYAAVVGVKTAAANEQAQVSFQTLLKSTEGARKMIGDLQQFAATTPFEFQQVREGAQQMLAYGIAARDVLPMMRIIGDAASASPKGMAQGMESITRAIGQMKGRGKVSSQEMLQLTEAGVNAWEMLAKGIGKSVADTQKMVEDGAINSGTGIKALLEGMQGQFGGNMKVQSQTMLGQISNIKDNFKLTMGEMAEDAMNALNVKGILSGVADAIGWVREEFKSLKEGNLSSMVTFAAPLLPMIPAVIKLGGLLLACVNPVTAVLAGIAGVVIGVKWLMGKAEELKSPAKNLQEAQRKAAEEVMKKNNIQGRTADQFLNDGWWKQNVKIAKEMEEAVNRNHKALGKLGDTAVKDLSIVKNAVSPAVAEFEKLRKEFQTEIGEVGLTAEMKKIKHLQAQGGTAKQVADLQALLDQKKALEDRNKMFEDGVKLIEDMRTPYETLNVEMDRLNKFLNAGAIGWGTYERAVAKANEKYQETLPLTKLINDTFKDLKDRQEKANFTDRERTLRALTQQGADQATKARYEREIEITEAAERANELRKEAQRLNISELTGLEKVKHETERIMELRRNGLDKGVADTMLKKVKDDYLKDQAEKNKVTSPGLALAGSQEAYKAMVASTQVGSARSEEAKLLERTIAPIQKTAEETGKVNNNFAKLSEDMRRVANVLESRNPPYVSITGN